MQFNAFGLQSDYYNQIYRQKSFTKESKRPALDTNIAIEKSHQVLYPQSSFRSPVSTRNQNVTFSSSQVQDRNHEGRMREIKRMAYMSGLKGQSSDRSHGFNQPNQTRISTSENVLMKEIIGIRRSMQNINYKVTCVGCNDQPQQTCPMCGIHNQQRNVVAEQNYQTFQQTHNPRTMNSCSYRNISPIADQQFSPRLQVANQGHGAGHSYTEVQKNTSNQRADARTSRVSSHRKFDLQQIDSQTELASSQNTQQPFAIANRTTPSSGLFNVSQLQQTTRTAAIGSQSPHSNGLFNVSSHFLKSPRPASSAIQKPCQHCSNSDCFSPKDGRTTCCFQLLQKNEPTRTPKVKQVIKVVEHTQHIIETSFATSPRQQDRQHNVSVEVVKEDSFWINKDVQQPMQMQQQQQQQQPWNHWVPHHHQPAEKQVHTKTVQRPRKKKQKQQPPKVMVQAAVQTQTQDVETAKVEMEVQTVTENVMVTSACQVSPRQPIVEEVAYRGNYELQSKIAMINKLCVYHLDRSTNLDHHRRLYTEAREVLEVLQSDPDVKNQLSVMYQTNENERNDAIDEDMLYEKVKVKADAILTPSASHFKQYKLPTKLEGNLLLIMYLLRNTLEVAEERLKALDNFSMVKIPRVLDHHANRYGRVSDPNWSRYKSLTASYEVPEEVKEVVEEPQMQFSSVVFAEEEVMEMGLADVDPVSLNKVHSRNNGSDPYKADLASFDREKFYKRIGFNMDEEKKEEPQEDYLMVAEICTTEFGSEGLADNQDITLEKSSLDVSTRKVKPDMQSFDYNAFILRQGVTEDNQEMELVEINRMSTEEFEEELADHQPIELTKTNEFIKRQLPPDMSHKVKPVPVIIEKTLELPICLALTAQPRSYFAAKQEEFEAPVDSDESNAENIDSSEQEDHGEYMTVKKSAHESKLKLFDYAFDERQNLHEDLMQVSIKKIIKQEGNFSNLHDLLVFSPDRKSEMQHFHSLHKDDMFDQQDLLQREFLPNEAGDLDRRYLNEDEANFVNDAVNFVSPVSRLAKDKNQREFLLKRNLQLSSPSPDHILDENDQPYRPYRSSRRNHFTQKHQPMQQFKFPGFTSSIHSSRHERVPKRQTTPQPLTPNHDRGRVKPSAPSTKLELNEDTFDLYSERLAYNKDPKSYNRGQITINDDGDMDMSDSLSPIALRETPFNEDNPEDAKTFVSQHLLFSHLMSFDPQKNTLSKLNNAKSENLLQKGIQYAARGVADSTTMQGQSVISRSISRRSAARANSRAGSRGSQAMFSARGRSSLLQRLLTGKQHAGGNAPSRSSFISGDGGLETSNHKQQVPSILIKQASSSRSSSKSFIMKEKSSSLMNQRYLGEHAQSFEPIMMIPEQMIEETQRNLFKKDQQETIIVNKLNQLDKSQHSSSVLQKETEDDMGKRNDHHEDKQKNKRMSNMSKYLVGSSSDQVQLSQKYLDRNQTSEDYSVFGSGSNTLRQMQAEQQQQQVAPPAFITQSPSNVLLKENHQIYYPIQPESNGKRSVSTAAIGNHNHHRTISSIDQQMHSRDVIDGRTSVNSGWGGRQSAQQHDVTSSLYQRRLIDTKGPQTSQIMPIFRMTKAQPIEYDTLSQSQIPQRFKTPKNQTKNHPQTQILSAQSQRQDKMTTEQHNSLQQNGQQRADQLIKIIDHL